MTTTKELTFEALTELMNSHWGSERFFKHSFMRKLIYTEGIQHLCDVGGMYWLLNMVASYIPKVTKENAKNGDYFQIVRLTVNADSTATFDLRHDTDDAPFVKQDISFTDAPCGVYEMYLINEGEQIVFLLKTEY